MHAEGRVPEEILYDRTKTVWLRDEECGEPVFHSGLLDLETPWQRWYVSHFPWNARGTP